MSGEKAAERASGWLKQVHRTIEREHLITEKSRVLAGVSGGADSVCLLLVLLEYRELCPFTLEAVHVEHGLRGEESLKDAGFVRELCRELGVPLEVRHVDVRGEAERTGESIEEAARRLRYAAMADCAGERGLTSIAAAHHAGDQAETVLLNLARGAGMRGLGGMPFSRELAGGIVLIRPLLECRRESIEAYLRARGQDWRTDSSNLSSEYTRNRIRTRILPLLEEEVNRESIGHIAEAAARIRRVESYLDRQAREAAVKMVSFDGDGASVDTGLLREEDPVIQEAVLRQTLRRVLKDRGLKNLRALHVEQMRQLFQGGGERRLSLPGSLTVIYREGRLLFCPEDAMPGAKAQDPPAGPAPVRIDLSAGEGTVRWYTIGEERFRVTFFRPEKEGPMPDGKTAAWISCGALTEGTCLRTRREGDYLLLRSGEKKKLTREMIDRKIPRSRRGSVILLADGSHVLWAAGMGMSYGARITPREVWVMEIRRL